MADCSTGAVNGAEVIPFPGRGPNAEERLKAAAVALDAAMRAQCAAVAQWRAALSALEGNAHALRASLDRYGGQLGAVQAQTRQVNAAARSLEAWADGALAAQRGK